MKKILLTGSTGFVGKNLKEKLSDSFDLHTPNRCELNLLEQEQVEEYLEKNRFDVVIHAANTNDVRDKTVTPYDSLNRNLQMFFNLEKCSKLYGKMYYYGSGMEYDVRHYVPNMREEYFGTYIPQDPYGFSKYVMGRKCEPGGNIYDLCLFGIYGKYEEWERRFISNAICRALKGMDITLQKHVYFDYLWVEDLAEIMRWFIENEPRYNRYNVCRGTKIDLYSLAELVREILGIDCNIVVKEEGWKLEYTGDNRRMINETGDFKFIGWESSVIELCNYYKEHIDYIDENKLV